MNKTNKKANMMVWSGLFLILIISVLVIFLFGYEKPEEKSSYFTPQPETWLESDLSGDEAGVDKSDNAVEVNVFKATRGNSVYEVNQQDYNMGGETLSLFTKGYYKGVPFNRVYFDDAFYTDTKEMSEYEIEKVYQKYLKMKIGPALNPTDGVIEGFILLRLDKESSGIYIFVDEDWRQQLNFTNIIWGDDFNSIDSMHVMEFDFRDSNDGIYITKIDKGLGWFFMTPVSGGMVVGEVNINIMSDLINKKFVNSTFMYVR